MENERQIQININGDTCTFNYADESQTSKSKISGQQSLYGSLANFDDLTLTPSKAADDYTPIHKNINKINKVSINKNNLEKKFDNINEKSKFEITCMSIFNSDLKNENSSIKKTPFYQNSINKIDENNQINNNNIDNEKDDIKDSVIKKLNFDICTSAHSSEYLENNEEENKEPFTYNISKNLNECYFIHEKNVNNIYDLNTKDNKLDILNDLNTKSFEKNKKKEEGKKHFEIRCKTVKKEKKPQSKILVDSNDSDRNHRNINNKNVLVNINNQSLFQNNSSSKIAITKINKNIINNNNIQEIMQSEKYKERKEKLKKYFDKLADGKSDIRANYIKLTSEKLKKESNISNKIFKKEIQNLPSDEKNKIKIREDILKTSEKLFPQLSSTNSFNTSNSKKNKLILGQLSSIKKNYNYQTPSSTTNVKIGTATASTKKGSINSNLNTPIISNSSIKMNSFSRTDNKNVIMKLYYGDSTSKKIMQNNGFELKKKEFLVDREKDSIKYLLKKHNTDLKNVLKINNKKIQTILNNKNKIGNSNTNRINEINEFKQYIQKNQFDKEMLKKIKKRGSFH